MILNWSLQYFGKNYNLVSHTTYVACVNFKTLFIAILFILTIFAKSLLKGNCQRIIFSYFIFLEMSYLQCEPSLTSNRPTHYILHYDDFTISYSQLLLIAITYIIRHYNPSVRIIDVVSHFTHVVCVNFMH